jgi:hypothetical protein
VAVLQKRIAGTAARRKTWTAFACAWPTPPRTLKRVTGFPKKQFSLESVALRLASPFFLAPAAAYPPVLTAARHAKASAARAKAEAVALVREILCIASFSPACFSTLYSLSLS